MCLWESLITSVRRKRGRYGICAMNMESSEKTMTTSLNEIILDKNITNNNKDKDKLKEKNKEENADNSNCLIF